MKRFFNRIGEWFYPRKDYDASMRKLREASQVLVEWKTAHNRKVADTKFHERCNRRIDQLRNESKKLQQVANYKGQRLDFVSI